MPRFTHVEIHPPTGHPDQLWDEGDDRSADAFARSARGVCELYDEALAALRVPAPRGMLRLVVWSHQGGTRDLEVLVHAGSTRDLPGEVAGLRLPDVVGELAPPARAELALATVHAAVLRLAEVRGWDPAPFEACRRHVVDAGFVYRWASPWKASPGRRWEARGTFRLTPDDGYGRVRLEVRERGAGDGPVSHSPEAVAFSTAAGFRRSAGSLRWQGPAEVGLTPYAGLGPAYWSGSLRASAVDGAWAFAVRDDVVVRSPTGRPGPSTGTSGPVPTVRVVES